MVRLVSIGHSAEHGTEHIGRTIGILRGNYLPPRGEGRGRASRAVLDALAAGPLTRAELVRQVGRNLDAVSRLLFLLRRKGLVSRLPGRPARFARAA